MFERSPAELKDVIAAERIGHPFLVWRDTDGHQRILALGPATWRVTIGRDPEADVSLDGDAEVSRAHALIERVGQEWTFVDDGLSRNGSFINQTRALGRRRLVDHDRISCGNSEIVFREPVVKTGDSTVSSRDLAPVLPLSPMQRKVLIALCRPVQASDTRDARDQPPDLRGGAPHRRRGQGAPTGAVRALRPRGAAPEREARPAGGHGARCPGCSRPGSSEGRPGACGAARLVRSIEPIASPQAIGSLKPGMIGVAANAYVILPASRSSGATAPATRVSADRRG